MGTFDRIELDGIEWQTKALGKTMHTLRPGDRVSAARVASTDDPRNVRGYTYDDLPDRYLVEIHAVEYVLVENGKLVGWPPTPTVRNCPPRRSTTTAETSTTS